MYQLFGSSLIVPLNCNLGLDLDCYAHFWPDFMVFSAIQAANFYRLYILGAGSLLHPWKAGDLSPEKAKSFILGKSIFVGHSCRAIMSCHL